MFERFFFFFRKGKHHLWVCQHTLLDLLQYVYLLYLLVCTVHGRASHPNRTLVSGVRGRHGHGATAPLGHAGGLEHAGIEACMSAGMLRQMVASHETLITQGAVEALLAGVCAVVTR